MPLPRSREMGWACAAIAAFAIGSVCAKPYAELAAPYYTIVDRCLALGHPWKTGTVEVKPNDRGPGFVLVSTSEVRRQYSDTRVAARTVARVQVGEAIETPVVFWTLLLLWPAKSTRARLQRYAVGLPMFFGLEAITTAVQFIYVLPEASARLAGETDPVTLLERWSRFLEGGGRYVVEVFFVLMTVAFADRLALWAWLGSRTLDDRQGYGKRRADGVLSVGRDRGAAVKFGD
jgi:hypothetical protein